MIKQVLAMTLDHDGEHISIDGGGTRASTLNEEAKLFRSNNFKQEAQFVRTVQVPVLLDAVVRHALLNSIPYYADMPSFNEKLKLEEIAHDIVYATYTVTENKRLEPVISIVPVNVFQQVWVR